MIDEWSGFGDSVEMWLRLSVREYSYMDWTNSDGGFTMRRGGGM